MNSISEKEKKLSSVLERLKNLNLKNQEFDSNISDLENKKNQLEIEKKELEDKFNLLREDYDSLSKKLFVKIEFFIFLIFAKPNSLVLELFT